MVVKLLGKDKMNILDNVDQIIIKASSGSRGIMNNHIPIVGSFDRGKIEIISKSNRKIFNSDEGIFIFENNIAEIVTNNFE